VVVCNPFTKLVCHRSDIIVKKDFDISFVKIQNVSLNLTFSKKTDFSVFFLVSFCVVSALKRICSLLSPYWFSSHFLRRINRTRILDLSLKMRFRLCLGRNVFCLVKKKEKKLSSILHVYCLKNSVQSWCFPPDIVIPACLAMQIWVKLL